MTREEFVEKLRKKISILQDSEIEDIISEYESYIDEKIASGMTEKAAVKSLGDVNEIAKDLLDAYKVNKDYSDLSAKEVVDELINKTTNAVDSTVKAIEKKSAGDILEIILKIIFLLIIIRICRFPIEAILSLSEDVFMVLGHSFGGFLYHLFEFVINLIYFVLSVVFFFRVLKTSIIGDDDSSKEETNEEKKKTKKKTTKKDDNKKEEQKAEEKKSDLIKKDIKNHSFGDTLIEIIVCFIKFIVFFIAIGNMGTIFGGAVVIAILIYLLICGVTYFGPLMIALSALIISIAFLEVFIRFIFDKKQRAVSFIVSLLIGLILGGAGIGVFSIEIANTTITKIKENAGKVLEKEITMKDNIVIGNDYVNEYIVDETMKDKVKIVYNYYFKYVDIDAKLDVDNDNGYIVYTIDDDISWNKKSFNRLIKDLKKKQLYNYEGTYKIKVYSSKENIEKIKKNNDEYIKRDIYDDDIEDIDRRNF